MLCRISSGDVSACLFIMTTYYMSPNVDNLENITPIHSLQSSKSVATDVEAFCIFSSGALSLLANQ